MLSKKQQAVAFQAQSYSARSRQVVLPWHPICSLQGTSPSKHDGCLQVDSLIQTYLCPNSVPARCLAEEAVILTKLGVPRQFSLMHKWCHWHLLLQRHRVRNRWWLKIVVLVYTNMCLVASLCVTKKYLLILFRIQRQLLKHLQLKIHQVGLQISKLTFKLSCGCTQDGMVQQLSVLIDVFPTTVGFL